MNGDGSGQLGGSASNSRDRSEQSLDSLNAVALSGSIASFVPPRGPRLLERIEPLLHWFDKRLLSGVDSYAKSSDSAPRPTTAIRDRAGRPFEGINFASQDYLSLSSHPKIKAAARSAIEEMGVHSAGSPALMGNTKLSLALERCIAKFTGYGRHTHRADFIAAGVAERSCCGAIGRCGPNLSGLHQPQPQQSRKKRSV